MPPETIQRIFDPFFTTKEVGRGTGLGLATVHGIVTQHQGWIEVDSAVGQGTTFRILLPKAEAAAETPSETQIFVASHGGDETVLLVEDEPAVREMVQRSLTRAGYTVVTADNGPHARKAWRKHSDQIDLLLTDLVMPGGVSGHQLARELRKARPDLCLVFTSGFDPEEGGEGAPSTSDGIFLPKPFTTRELLRTVRAALDEQGFSG